MQAKSPIKKPVQQVKIKGASAGNVGAWTLRRENAKAEREERDRILDKSLIEASRKLEKRQKRIERLQASPIAPEAIQADIRIVEGGCNPLSLKEVRRQIVEELRRQGMSGNAARWNADALLTHAGKGTSWDVFKERRDDLRQLAQEALEREIREAPYQSRDYDGKRVFSRGGSLGTEHAGAYGHNIAGRYAKGLQKPRLPFMETWELFATESYLNKLAMIESGVLSW